MWRKYLGAVFESYFAFLIDVVESWVVLVTIQL